MNQAKKQHFRFLAGLLALCTLLPLTAACGNEDGTSRETGTGTSAGSGNTTETEPLDALDARRMIDDGLGEYDFEEAVFRIGTCNDATWIYFMEEEDGDTIHDAVYRRNAAVEDRFNCKIEIVFDQPQNEATKLITNYISAGDDAFDLLAFQVVQLGLMVINDFFLNWYDIPNIDFTKPWWSKSNSNDLTYNDVCISAIGDFSLFAATQMYCVYYNKELGANYDFPDLFEVVNNGQWTIDYITERTKDIYVDLNQNGSEDIDDDLFGYATDTRSNFVAYQWAFNNPIFRKNGDVMEYAFRTTKINDIVEKLIRIFNDYDGLVSETSLNTVDGFLFNFPMEKFPQNEVILANGTIGSALGLRDMEADYSILPYPKWDEAQKEYYTMSDGSHHVFAIPITITAPEFVGTITEALNAESYKILMPAYYDVALKVKGTRDEESVAMLDMIVDSCVFDFGYVYDAWRGASFLIQDLAAANNSNFQSAYERKEKSIMKHYNEVIEYFENYSR